MRSDPASPSSLEAFPKAVGHLVSLPKETLVEVKLTEPQTSQRSGPERPFCLEINTRRRSSADFSFRCFLVFFFGRSSISITGPSADGAVGLDVSASVAGFVSSCWVAGIFDALGSRFGSRGPKSRGVAGLGASLGGLSIGAAGAVFADSGVGRAGTAAGVASAASENRIGSGVSRGAGCGVA